MKNKIINLAKMEEFEKIGFVKKRLAREKEFNEWAVNLVRKGRRYEVSN